MLYHMSAETAGHALSLAVFAMTVTKWMTESISIVELFTIISCVIVVSVSVQIYMILRKLKTTLTNLKQTAVHSADKLTHSEVRLMNFTITAHEAERQLVQSFFDWDISIDRVFFVRKMTQWCELWSAAQHRAGLPCGLQEWQWILQSAIGKINKDITDIEDEKDREYYVKSMEIFEGQRVNHETTAVPSMSGHELRCAYQEKVRGIGCLMPSLDFQ